MKKKLVREEERLKISEVCRVGKKGSDRTGTHLMQASQSSEISLRKTFYQKAAILDSVTPIKSSSDKLLIG